MKLDRNRLAAAVAAAALSLPAFATEPAPACAVCGDPTWPAVENPAPAVPVAGPQQVGALDLTAADYAGTAHRLVVQGPATLAALDLTQPDYVGAAPAIVVPAAARGGAAAHVAAR